MYTDTRNRKSKAGGPLPEGLRTGGAPILCDEVEVGILHFRHAPDIHVVAEGWPSWLVAACSLSLNIKSVSCLASYLSAVDLPPTVELGHLGVSTKCQAGCGFGLWH